jgi:hypothetical protein
MNAIALNLLVVLVSAGGADDKNPLLAQLVEKGVAMPTGTLMKLPSPTMVDGLTTDAQTEVISKVAAANRYDLKQFLNKDSSAPIGVKIKSKTDGTATIRSMDLSFVAYGKWEVLVSEEFANGFAKAKKQEGEQKGHVVSKSGFLTVEETKQHGLPVLPKTGPQERFFYTTFMLFDQAEISATRDAVLTKTPGSVTVACRVDPRFAKDAVYPNQWRSVDRDAAGKIVYGKPQPYSGAAFYVKATKLAKPEGAIFVEYHSAFNEPQGWFNGEPTLRGKLPMIAQHEIKQFRQKLAMAK